MWQIKRELSEQFPTWSGCVTNLMDYQKKIEQDGVRVVNGRISKF